MPVHKLHPRPGYLPSKRHGYIVKFQTWVLPEKIAWVIKRRTGKSRKTVCKGGPYQQWYSVSPFDTGCRLSKGHYEVICKDSVYRHGFGGGYLKIGSLKICKAYDWEKGKWAKAELHIGKRQHVQEPGLDYPWLMRLRLQHERLRLKRERLRLKRKRLRLQRERREKNSKSMLQDVGKIMQSLAQATEDGSGSAGKSSKASDTDLLGAKRLMAQATLASAEAQVKHAVEVWSNHSSQGSQSSQSRQIQHEAKATVAVAASADLTGAKTLVNATAEKQEMSLELIAELTKVISNHSLSHGGRCPSQISLLGTTAELSNGIGCHFEYEGRPLCSCASWPFKVCTGHQAKLIQLFGHCRLAMWPLVLIFFILLTSAAWAVVLAFHKA